MYELIDAYVTELSDNVSKLKISFKGSKLSKNVVEAFNNFPKSLKNYQETIENSSNLKINLINAAVYVSNSARQVAFAVNAANTTPEQKSLAENIHHIAQTFENEVANNEDLKIDFDESNDFDNLVKLPERKIRNSYESQESTISDINKRVSSLKSDIENLESTVSTFESVFNDARLSYAEEFSRTIKALKERSAEVDALVGHISERSLSGDFDKSAASEKFNANALRFLALLFMGAAVGVAGLTLYESTQDVLEWQSIAARTVLALLFSVPAAYLAKESSRHRVQQYLYLQTSLSLKALPSYAASLPENVQHELKVDMANRIFHSTAPLAGGDTSIPNV